MMSTILLLLTFAAIMWIVELVNWAIGYDLNSLGIFPRTTSGLIGIPLAPFLHGSIGFEMVT